jgi:Flp pilus assembly protein TadG
MSEKKNRQGRASKRQKPWERGQSLVETAVVLPILFLLLAAVIDFGRAFDVYIVLTNAAREGARFGAVNPELTDEEVQEIVIEDVMGSGTNLTPVIESAIIVQVSGQHAGSDAVTVSVTYPFVPWFGRLIGMDTVNLTKVSVMPRWRND